MGIKLFQINVKCAFLNGFSNEQVYIEQPYRFEISEFLDHLFKIHKTSSKSLDEWLGKFLLGNNFTRGKISKTLFIKTKENDFLIIHVYMNSITFGATNNVLCQELSSLICEQFEMSIIGELNLFLSLQIKQYPDDKFIN